MVLLALTFNCLMIIASSISCGDGQNGSPPQTCGPASSMQCIGFEQCATDTLICSPSTSCSILCDGGTKSCSQTKIDATQADGLSLVCDADSNTIEGCKGASIEAASSVDITCNGGQYSCSYLTVNASLSSDDVTITCDGFNSCNSGVHIYCGSGQQSAACNIECHGGQSCTGLHLECGTSECAIYCSGGGTECVSVTVDASQADSFECVGTTSECQHVYNNLVTAAPTAAANNPTTSVPTTTYPTTDNPTTNTPTTNEPTTTMPTTNTPTTYVPTTINPTQLPSASPTISHVFTKSPTNMPTNIPTQIPTTMQTKTPTKTNGEQGVNEIGTTNAPYGHDDDDAELETNNTQTASWVYVLIILLVLLVLLAGTVLCIRHKRKKAGHIVFEQTGKGIVVGSMSPTSNEGNNMKETKLEQHLVDNVFASNVLMDDIVTEIDTPMGPNDTVASISVEMNNAKEGLGDNIMDDMIIVSGDETPSHDAQEIITSGADAESTDSMDDAMDEDEQDILHHVNHIQMVTPMGDDTIQ